MLDRPSFGEIYGKSAVMRRLYATLERVASSEANVLIEGESGTGKELVATELVRRGPRAKAPFVIVDCGAIAPSLIESELFGHVRGAFTGADRERKGAFEAAHGGTMFLDEIGELPLELQPKLLRALEGGEIRKIGQSDVTRVDVRVIAATNRRLDREVNQGRFREDLFYRLSVVTVRVPPLRERLDDLELLVHAILDELSASAERRLFSPSIFAELALYEWPGNVRELRNYVERSVVLQTVEPTTSVRESQRPPALEQRPLDLDVAFRDAKNQVTEAFERRYLTALIAWADGNVSRAARKGKMDRMNLYRLIQRYGIKSSSLKD
jgi:transcriptional regulator with GAF, ATPase, and Fis domain